MISILIPVFNWNIQKLVAEISQQCSSLSIEFEILALDDCSTDDSIKRANRDIHLKNFQMIELNKNVGNAEARNELARAAKYDWLLFLDADMLPVESTFISKYIDLIVEADCDVISGGIVYQGHVSKEYRLKWLHGKKTEEHQITKDPYLEIRGNNFLIRKQLYRNILFGGLPEKYGYVDTQFGLKLKLCGAKVKIIDNPCLHLGLETNQRFVEKYKTSLRNAFWMMNNQPELAENLRIIKAYHKIERLGMRFLVSNFYQLFEKRIMTILYSGQSSLFIFQLFKLGYFCSLVETKHDQQD